jgi:hypothetical protein
MVFVFWDVSEYNDEDGDEGGEGYNMDSDSEKHLWEKEALNGME